MQIAVITVQREPMYLYDTLASLWASLEGCELFPILEPPGVEVFIGTPNCSKIEEHLRQAPCALAQRIPVDLWNLIEPLPAKLRAVGNFVHALRSGKGDLMLFEDDTAIKPGWLRAAQAINSIVSSAFISLYSHKDWRTDYTTARFNASDGVVLHPAALLQPPIAPDDFYGTLGLFVPEAHRQALAEYAMTQLRPTNPWPPHLRWPFDEIVKGYINDHRECSLAITIPSYVDHVGEVSVINPTHGPRRAPMF